MTLSRHFRDFGASEVGRLQNSSVSPRGPPLPNLCVIGKERERERGRVREGERVRERERELERERERWGERGALRDAVVRVTWPAAGRSWRPSAPAGHLNRKREFQIARGANLGP